MTEQLAVIEERRSLALLPGNLNEVASFAERMADSKLVPEHLYGKPADCFRVCLQASRWGFDPFAVADKTSVIRGKLFYEGQLVSAVINARGGLKDRLNYEYSGEGGNRSVRVFGTLRGETTPREINLPFALAKKINQNGQMEKNPDQQAAYIGARIWARRHMPELILGVYTPDEREVEPGEINVTGTGESGEPAVTASAPPPQPSKRGVAAVKESRKAAAERKAPAAEAPPPDGGEIVEAEIVDDSALDKSTPPPKQADKSTPPPTEKKTKREEPPPAKEKDSLQEGERYDALVNVISSQLKEIKGGKFVLVAEVSGEFSGLVIDRNEEVSEEYRKELYAEGSRLEIELLGVKNAKGNIVACVTDVEAIGQGDSNDGQPEEF